MAVTRMPNRLHDEAIQTDKEDLIALLEIRFGEIPDHVRQTILACKDRNMLERLIVVAANVPKFELFTDEMQVGPSAFRIVGNNYNPISMQ